MKFSLPNFLFTFCLAGVGYITGLKRRVRKKALLARSGSRKRLVESSLRTPGRHVAVVSTAAVPWMTGTAVNPTLRAAYLAHCTKQKVTLFVPWLAVSDQELTFPHKRTFGEPEQQEACMREWVLKRTGLSPAYDIRFYPGRYDQLMLGIFPVGDLTEIVRQSGADAVILEEPEHLTWFHHGPRWPAVFDHVVGVIHTSYKELSLRNTGFVLAGISSVLNAWLCAIHCHKVIKLSDAVQRLPREVTCCVHGAAPQFLEVGAEKQKVPPGGGKRFGKGAYCLAKVVWGKGWEELLELLGAHQKAHPHPAPGEAVSVDAFGEGEGLASVKGKAEKADLPLRFHSRRDHLDPSLHDYSVFINASTSDVVATTSMEALAMGKWLICARHPCNTFLSTFSNTLVYDTPEQFSTHLMRALETEPPPLSPAELRELSWEAATERMLDSGTIGVGEWPGRLSSANEDVLWSAYNAVIGIEPLRRAVCAGAETLEAPQRVTDYDPHRRSSRLSWLGSFGRPVWRCALSLGPVSLGVGNADFSQREWSSLEA